jgi:myo-inositol-1(or 4)-monophosphatase
MTNNERNVADIAQTGADYALEHFRAELTIEEKADKTDLVTEVDRGTQRRIVSAIEERFPNDEIVGEEEDERKTVPDEGYAWIIDPIDGTQNYIWGNRVWVTSVAVVHDSVPMKAVNIAPALDEVYRATATEITRGGRSISVNDRIDPETFIVAATLRWTTDDTDMVGNLARIIIDRFGELRRIGSAQLTLSMVASGVLDAAVAFNNDPNPWDTVAGTYHVARAGGTVTDIYGDSWDPASDGIVASNGNAHEAVRVAVRDAIE